MGTSRIPHISGPDNPVLFPARHRLPWVVFVHGLGVSGNIWASPHEERVMGGLVPVSSLVRGGGGLATLFQDFREAGFGVAAWSQERPVGVMSGAVEELRLVMRRVLAEKPSGVVLAGHSRGGLIARKYLEEAGPEIVAYASIGAPHGGSSMARWQKYIKPAAAFMKRLVREDSRYRFSIALRRMISFVESPAVKELLPGSDFFRSLRGPRNRSLTAVSVGGTDPHLFDFMGFPFPNTLARLVPERLVPVEMREGMGDGLVSAESSVYPFGGRHFNFHLNHGEILFDADARMAVFEEITSALQ